MKKINRIVKSIFNRLTKMSKSQYKVDLQDLIYWEFEKAFLNGASNFHNKIILPKNYGKGLPERVVEIYLARLTYRPGDKVLDVAHANAMICHLKMVASLPEPRSISGIDIAPPGFDTNLYYENSYTGDITKTELPDNSFDLIWCISALEHFGMDNSGYTENFSRESDADMLAVKEMLRLLKIGGTLLITVPYGRFEDHGWFKNYDGAHWRALLNLASKQALVQEFYFGHTYGAGWAVVSPEELINVGYFNQANSGSGALAATCITKLS
jgi:SAM-dependent methyltransferase